MSDEMQYESTRGGDERVPFTGALLSGLAKNGGLFWPTYIPRVNLQELWGMTFIELALTIFGLFAPDIHREHMREILKATYTKAIFGDERITPVYWLEPKMFGIVELSNGPTLAFKDVALQLLPNILQPMLELAKRVMNIVIATSGDTGSAAEYGVIGKSRLNAIVLSPYGRMSEEQQLQMYTIDEPNVHNIQVRTSFDGCQSMVKAVNNDLPFKEKYSIGAFNSINWCRIVAQVVYYFAAYFQAARHPGDMVIFVVPSGNFGNALAAYVAQQMGLPIRIIIATNENDLLDKFLRTGVYQVTPKDDVKVTSSPSMDIADASNFERIVFNESDRNGAYTARLWGHVNTTGTFTDEELSMRIRRLPMRSGSATQVEVVRTIRHIHRRYGRIIDPHTAVAMKVALDAEHRNVNLPTLVMETAHHGKFPLTIEEAVGFRPEAPEALTKLRGLPRKTTVIDPDVHVLKEFIAAHARQ